ncbi:hypothetical protein ETQ85_25565 [Zoogloea oleivorans]|uniref:Uncharacterized protein n=1 Tax=Zoogloea oleivorans TaxID=1552750 RepID=A0A6C2C7W1_9RHOO|nr:hypothetical protein ETQ85_25565 [Zoogloea oleivorans]
MAMRAPGGQGGRHRRNWRWSTAPACIAGNGDAAARRARDQVAGTASPEVAMLEKKSRLDLGRLSRGRAAVIACNAPGHR